MTQSVETKSELERLNRSFENLNNLYSEYNKNLTLILVDIAGIKKDVDFSKNWIDKAEARFSKKWVETLVIGIILFIITAVIAQLLKK